MSPDGGTSFMDEDYQLDMTQITAIAIGAVNPLGIGPVSFTISNIDLLPASIPADTVNVTISGQTLSVNDHEMIPAGLFGGFAPFIPQRYRPGTQRNLNTLPGGYANSPYKAYTYGGDDIPNDPIAFIQAIHANTWPKLNTIAGQGIMKNIAKRAVEPKKAKDKKRWPGNARKEVLKFLSAVMKSPQLLDHPAAKKESKWIKMAKSAEPNSGDATFASRKILDAILGRRPCQAIYRWSNP